MTERDVKDVVETETGFLSCYGCAKCTSGCPMAEHMEIKPHQAMRLLKLGRVDELVVSSSPWQCMGCQTCLARCPNKVDIPAAFARIRAEAIRREVLQNAGNVPLFDELFLGMIERHGRVSEGLLSLRYKLRAGGLLSDWRIGLKLWKAGKLKLSVPTVDDTCSIARLFTDIPVSEEPTQ